MATLYISEFSNLPFVSNGVIQAAAVQEWLNDQAVALSASPAASNAFGQHANYVVLSADSVCSIAWTLPGESTQNAATTNLRIPADVPVIFGVTGAFQFREHGKENSSTRKSGSVLSSQ